eukprot:975863-Pyramimonas_sp.AAC.1
MFFAAPERGEPKLDQVLVRTARNLQTREYFERGVVAVGMAREELSQPLPLTGGNKTTRTCGLPIFARDVGPPTQRRQMTPCMEKPA